MGICGLSYKVRLIWVGPLLVTTVPQKYQSPQFGAQPQQAFWEYFGRMTPQISYGILSFAFGHKRSVLRKTFAFGRHFRAQNCTFASLAPTANEQLNPFWLFPQEVCFTCSFEVFPNLRCASIDFTNARVKTNLVFNLFCKTFTKV